MPVYDYQAIVQPDVCYMEFGQIRIRCFVWLDKTVHNAATVESAAFIEQEDGTEVLYFRQRVRTPAEFTECDCPRIVRCGSQGAVFLVTWLEGNRAAGNPDIMHATLAPILYGTVPTWTFNDVLVTTSDYWLYDLCNPVDDPTHVFLAHRDSATTLDYIRLDTALAADWTTTHTVGSSNRVLTVGAHTTDNIVGQAIVAFEGAPDGASAYTMIGVRMDWDDGTIQEVWTALSGVGAYLQGGLARAQAQRWLLVTEVQDGSGFPFNASTITMEMTSVHYRMQNTSTGAPTGAVSIARNLRLLSRPWTWSNASAAGSPFNVYAVVGFSETARSDFGQLYAHVVNFDAQALTAGQKLTTGRPRPVANLNVRLPDTRVSGFKPGPNRPAGDTAPPGSVNGRRVNHVTSASAPPSVGPFRKGRVVALATYSRMMSVGESGLGDVIIPVSVDVIGYRVINEEPWTYERDAFNEDTDGPTNNVKVTWAWDTMQPFEVADMLAILGGTPSIYDGERVVEVGFSWYPEIVQVVDTEDEGDPGPFLADEVRYYTAVYEWIDARGHVHRSAPAIPFIAEVDSQPSGADSFEVDVLCQNLSAKIDDFNFDSATPISIVLYRTTDGSTIFRRVYGETVGHDFAVHLTPENDPDEYTIQIVDTLPDDELADNDLLPWQFLDGAWVPLVPVQPPAASVGCVWRNRVWLVPNEAQTQLWYSLEVQPGPGAVAIAAPEFNTTNVFRLDADPFLVTALVPLDDALVVFARDAVYMLTGFLNDDTGVGQDLQLRVRQRGVGCLSQRSVVRSPVGIFFQSDRGIQLLDESGAVDNVSAGSSVQSYVDSGGNIRAAALFEDRQQVVFVTNGGDVDGAPLLLVYDYFHKMWFRHTMPLAAQTPLGDGDDRGCNAVDCVAWRGVDGETLRVVLEQQACLIERPSTTSPTTRYADQINDGTEEPFDTRTYNQVTLQTGWIGLAGWAGFQRVRSVGILSTATADTNSPDIEVTVDYERASGAYSTTDPLQDVFALAAPYSAYVEVRPRVQKVAAIRLTISETGTFTTLPEWSVVGVTLNVGIKRGPRRVGPTQRAS